MYIDYRNEFSERADTITSVKDASEYLEELAGVIGKMNVEHVDVVNYVSAMSGFIEDFIDSGKMSDREVQRLCTIIFETLFYE